MVITFVDRYDRLISGNAGGKNAKYHSVVSR